MELVDDRDPRVKFGPKDAWFTGGVEDEHSGTTHGTDSANASMSFQFSGTYIEVWGTIPHSKESPVKPVTQFTIDDGTPTSYAPLIQKDPVRRQKMFVSKNLADGNHELRMVNTQDKGRVWIDYLAFSPSGVDMQSDIEIVDDRDTRVSFNPGNAWFLAGVAEEHLGTTHGTTSANAEMVFRFKGTYIEVYGTNPHRNESPVDPVTAFTVDDGTPVNYAPSITDTPLQRQRMFASPNLTAGEHTLRMVNTRENGKVWLDYLAFVPSGDGQPQPTTSTSIILSTILVPTRSPTISIETKAGATASGSIEPSTDSSTGSNSLSSGAIVGIVLACVVLLAMAIAVLWWWLRTRKEMDNEIDSIVPAGSENRTHVSRYLNSELSQEHASLTRSTMQSPNQPSWHQYGNSVSSSGPTNSDVHYPVSVAPTSVPPPYR
ncbi:hypothetical protein VNI00_009774 [Paramarasmius palmivorus]|uniref:Transmembrane protein n=1 Tax=Paramarasmius palmivorus TaxID=297713 RepID=A0AAW0CK98_9AGAR